MGETAPQVVVIAGPNGAGKTTLSPFLLRDQLRVFEYVNADPIAQGLSAFDPASMALQAGRVMLNRLQKLADQRKTFAFETTLSAKHYSGWIKKLRAEGYAFQLMFLWLQSPELAVQRVCERVHAGGHDVPEHIIRRRYAAGLRNFSELYQPLANTWAVYDNSGSLNPTMIAQGDDLRSNIVDLELWNRFKAYRNEQ
jgi:predicted ABC-type ATPase